MPPDTAPDVAAVVDEVEPLHRDALDVRATALAVEAASGLPLRELRRTLGLWVLAARGQ